MTPRQLRLLAATVGLSLGLAWPFWPVDAHDIRTNLSVTDMFTTADDARAAGRIEDALTIYEALSHDPDVEVRAEARFRKGMLLADEKRYAEAAVAFRALLDEKPNAARVRLELARMLAAMGDADGARRAVRQAQAAGIPPEVALVVDQFANALRSTKLLGGSIQFAFAPDSNVNRATSAQTLDTIIAPLTLSEDARAQSGIGIRAAGQIYARIPIGSRLSILPRMSGSGNFYRKSEFDDVSASALVGIEWQGRTDRVTPSIGITKRWYGGESYARTETATIDWTHAIGRLTRLSASASASRARYDTNRLQDGAIFDLGVSVERALSARTGVGAALSATRQTARDPGYATMSEGGTLFGWREAGQMTFFVSAGLRRTDGDARLFLFRDRRREWLYQLSASATFRQFTFHGFAPLVRIGWEQNKSTVGLYDYRRLSTDIGITRAF